MDRELRYELYEKVNTYFSLGELRTLAFDLNIDYEDLVGETKASKVKALIEYADRRGRLKDLIGYLAKLRPHVQWLENDLESQSISLNIGNVGIGAAVGMGASIRAENIAGHDITISGHLLKQEDDFKESLRRLQKLVEVLLTKGELSGNRPSVIVLENLKDISEEMSSTTPNARWILLRLEDIKRVLQEIPLAADIKKTTHQELIKSLEIVEQLILLSEKASGSSE